MMYDNNLNFFFSTTPPEFQPNKHVGGLEERKSGGMMPKVAIVSEGRPPIARAVHELGISGPVSPPRQDGR
jgi:hypothetical protein